MRQSLVSTRFVPLKWIWFFSCVCLLTFWRIPHIGEEGVYTLSVFEMWFHDHWRTATVLGQEHARPPLYQWLTAIGVRWVGFQHTLDVARFVSAVATMMTAAMLYGFSKRVFRAPSVGLWAAVIFLNGDVMVRRGWLAYADPLFSCFVCASIMLGWVACEGKSNRWLVGVFFSLSLAYLAKTYTCYLFYLSACMVWLWQGHGRFLCRWPSVIIHGAAFLFPVLWGKIGVQAGQTSANWDNLIYNLVFHLQGFQWLPYVKKLVKFPLELWVLLLPTSAIGIYLLLQRRTQIVFSKEYTPVLLFVVLAALPYWLVPHPIASRYLLPLMPMLSLLLAACVVQASHRVQRMVWLALSCVLALRLLGGVWFFPYDQTHRRGDARAAAMDILQRVEEAPLYVNDSSSRGLRVAWELNAQQNFQYPITAWQDVAPKQGAIYVLTGQRSTQYPLLASYRIDRGALYLECWGNDCATHHH